MQARKKDDIRRELMDPMHPRDKMLGGRVQWWSEKEARGMSQRARCSRGTRSWVKGCLGKLL